MPPPPMKASLPEMVLELMVAVPLLSMPLPVSAP
jgi:hypothetical protein